MKPSFRPNLKNISEQYPNKGWPAKDLSFKITIKKQVYIFQNFFFIG